MFKQTFADYLFIINANVCFVNRQIRKIEQTFADFLPFVEPLLNERYNTVSDDSRQNLSLNLWLA